MLGVFRFAEFDFECDVGGFMLHPLADNVPLDSVVTISTDRINWTNTLDNLTVVSNPPNNINLTQAVLRLLYAPLMDQLEGFMDLAHDAFLDSRHIQHCTVCLPESAVSIAWIVLLGTLQAASMICALTGYCIRRWNRELADAEQPLLQQDGQTEQQTVGSLPSSGRHARPQRQNELRRELLTDQERECRSEDLIL
jgi:hypothetical protein